MNAVFSYAKFCKELEFSLPASTVQQRKIWATTIIENDLHIKGLSRLLQCEHKVVSRFLWLLSETGALSPAKLLAELPFLFTLYDDLRPAYKTSFASYWLIAGLPPENESKAIDLLFQWLLSADTNVTIKSRSVLVLYQLTKKYPELKNELKICLEDRMDKYSKDFEKRAAKILLKLGARLPETPPRSSA
ncbi:MAG: hypothetical protein WC150_07245 [Bacteroidia bacterium]